jgi:hypothetical protein
MTMRATTESEIRRLFEELPMGSFVRVITNGLIWDYEFRGITKDTEHRVELHGTGGYDSTLWISPEHLAEQDSIVRVIDTPVYLGAVLRVFPQADTLTE